MKDNEFSASFLCCLITITEDAQKDDSVFQSKPVNVLSWFRLHSERLLAFPEFVGKLVLF